MGISFAHIATCSYAIIANVITAPTTAPVCPQHYQHFHGLNFYSNRNRMTGMQNAALRSSSNGVMTDILGAGTNFLEQKQL